MVLRQAGVVQKDNLESDAPPVVSLRRGNDLHSRVLLRIGHAVLVGAQAHDCAPSDIELHMMA